MGSEVLASYPVPRGAAVAKEITELDQHCRQLLAVCPFAVLSTVGPGGEPEISPRGGEPGFLHVVDAHTLLLPDRSGNNRLDSLRNLTVNPRVALLCLVPGIEETLRVYGRGELCRTEEAGVDLSERGRPARSVLRVHVDRAFVHCAKALMRSRLWDAGTQVCRDDFPSMSELMQAHSGDRSEALESTEDMRRRYLAHL